MHKLAGRAWAVLVSGLLLFKSITWGSRHPLAQSALSFQTLAKFMFAQRFFCSYIDYIIGDAVVSPPEMQHGYAEKLLVMPATFQVSKMQLAVFISFMQLAVFISFIPVKTQVTSHADEHPHPWPGSRDEVYVGGVPFPRFFNVGRRHNSEDLALHRAAAGMPAQGLLLCNFNQVFKLDPAMFDLWLNITASAPGSSLVLLRYPPEAERYLRATMRSKVRLQPFERLCFVFALRLTCC
jgi:hypothetical protein